MTAMAFSVGEECFPYLLIRRSCCGEENRRGNRIKRFG